MLLLFPFYRWGARGSQSVRHLSRATVSWKSPIQAQMVWLSSPILFHHHLLISHIPFLMKLCLYKLGTIFLLGKPHFFLFLTTHFWSQSFLKKVYFPALSYCHACRQRPIPQTLLHTRLGLRSRGVWEMESSQSQLIILQHIVLSHWMTGFSLTFSWFQRAPFTFYSIFKSMSGANFSLLNYPLPFLTRNDRDLSGGRKGLTGRNSKEAWYCLTEWEKHSGERFYIFQGEQEIST